MRVEDLLAQVRHNVERLRGELHAEELFLARLEATVKAAAPSPSSRLRKPEPSTVPASHASGSKDGAAEPRLRRLPPRKKGPMIVRLLQEGGRQKPRQIREALRARGIDPDAGTEVKRVLWDLAKNGKVARYPETGEYGPLEPTRNGHAPNEGGLVLMS